MTKLTITQYAPGDARDIYAGAMLHSAQYADSGTAGDVGYVYWINDQNMVLVFTLLDYVPAAGNNRADGLLKDIYVLVNSQTQLAISLDQPEPFSDYWAALDSNSGDGSSYIDALIREHDIDFLAQNATGPVNIRTGDHNDVLIGSAYDDYFYSHEGQNIFVGMAGNDTFDAYENVPPYGLDVAYYATEGGPYGITVDFLQYWQIIDTFGDTDRASGIEYVVGTALVDHYTGSFDTDWFQPGGGSDIIDMGRGIDYVVFDGNRANYTLNLTLGTVTHLPTGDVDHITGAEYLVFTDAAVTTEESTTFGTQNGDDLVLYNLTAGLLRFQEYRNATPTSLGNVGAVSQVAIGNFSADFTDDVLYRTTSGWYGRIDSNGVNTNIGFRSGQTLLAVGDFNGNGRDDLLFRTDASGWYSILEGATTGVNLGYRSGQTLVGVGDFNGDGQDDMLFRSGSGWLSYVQGGSFANVNVGFRSGQDLLAIGDFDGNGRDDLLFRSTSSGWMSYAQGATGANVNLGYRTGQTLLGVGDFNDDGRSDMLFARASGWMSYLDGDSGANVNVGFAPSGTTLRSIGDYDGYGDSDLLFAHGSSGAMTLMPGAVAATAFAFGNLNGQSLVSADFGTNMAHDMLIA